MKNGKCPKCGGTGKLQNDAVIGAAMKARREAQGLTLKELAERIGYSASYLCDLEHGRRVWSESLRNDYLKGSEKSCRFVQTTVVSTPRDETRGRGK